MLRSKDAVMASTFGLLGIMVIWALVMVLDVERLEGRRAASKAAAEPVEVVCREEVEWEPRADAIAYSATCDGGVVVTLLR